MPANYLDIPSEARALRAHIQHQTLAYAKRYITTDYISYTEDGVSKVFSASLHPVSPQAPTDITLPVDPLEKLLKYHEPSINIPYDEDFALSVDEQQGIKRVFGRVLEVKKRATQSIAATMAEEPNPLHGPLRPLSPILTARARSQTPKVLHRSRAQVIGLLPTDFAETTEKGRIHSVGVEEVVVDKIDEDKCLNIEYTITPEMAQEFRAFMARIPARQLGRPNALESTRCLRVDPPPPNLLPRPMSPPIFPRERRVGSVRKGLVTGGVLDSGSLTGLLEVIGARPTEVENKGSVMEDIARESHILPSSSPPPPPSLQPVSEFSSSDAAQPSSPPRTPTRIHPSEMAFLASSSPDACMERINEILFPKDQQRGRKVFSRKEPATLAEFVSHLHHPVPARPPIHAAPPIASIFTPASPAGSDSVVGQLGDNGDDESSEEVDELEDDPSAGILSRAGSRDLSQKPLRTTSRMGSKSEGIRQNEVKAKRPQAMGVSALGRLTSQSTVASDVDQLADDDTLVELVVEHLTQGLGIDPLEYAMQEKLDEKDTFLLDVPTLPPPNLHPVDRPPAPTKLSDLLGPSLGVTTNGEPSDKSPGQLGMRRVGGLQSLQLELEWRVTMPGECIPTHDQVARVGSVCDPGVKTLAKNIIKVLRTELDHGPRAEDRTWKDEEHAVVENTQLNDGPILTKRERTRVSCAEVERVLNPDALEHGISGRALYEEAQGSENEPAWSNSTGLDDSMDLDAEPAQEPSPPTQVSFVPLSFGSEKATNRRRQYSWNLDNTLEPHGHYNGVEWDEDAQDSLELSARDTDCELAPANSFLDEYGRISDPGSSDIIQDTVNLDKELQALDEPERPIQAEYTTQNMSELRDETATHPIHKARSLVLPTIERSQDIPPEWKNLQPKHSAQGKLASFMHNRGFHFQPPKTLPPTTTPVRESAPTADCEPDPAQSGPHPIPPDVHSMLTIVPYDAHAEEIPPHFCVLSSMRVMQHRALVRHLEHPNINLRLIERSGSSPELDGSWQNIAPPLHGASLSLDPSNAVVLIPLADLPSPDAVPALSRLVQGLLKIYDYVAIILEAYMRSVRGPSRELGSHLDPFTPPARKALAALRRTIALINGSLEANSVRVGIARTPQEEALLIRGVVDRAVGEWNGAHEVWGSREWIGDDENAEEQELGSIISMNIFASITILAQTTIDELLLMSAEERSEVFGPSVGERRVKALNEAIAKGQERVGSLDIL